ncbi:MAG: hypothetical protein ABI832_03035 [bacterium]
MEQVLRAFQRDEAGAVTVDWVVLTAAIVGLGMVVLIPIAYSSGNAAQGVSDYIGTFNSGYGNN